MGFNLTVPDVAEHLDGAVDLRIEEESLGLESVSSRNEMSVTSLPQECQCTSSYPGYRQSGCDRSC
jgi:hypothetical protein